jgi:hypothetical protein
MKRFRTIAALALFNAGLAIAGDDGRTNSVPDHVRNLLDFAGYSVAQKTVSLPSQDTHSLRNLHFIMRGPFMPLVVPAKKTGWNLWDNSSFKSVGREGSQISLLAPGAAIAQYEYDITYSFVF